jgi:heme-degrading monooxygenase HmoA
MQATTWHLAQINIGRMTGANINDPIMKDFVDKLDEVNAVAEKSKGFVWRLKDDNNNATGIKAFDDDQLIVNMSVWESIEDLEAFVYKTSHAEVLRRRKEWFSKMKFYMAMWYMPAGSVPAVEEAKRRLEHLELYGASAYAFDFKQRFAPPAESLNLP